MRTAAGGQSWPSTARPEDGLSPRLAGRWTRPKPRTRASTPREGDVRSSGGSQHRDLGPAPAGRLEARVVKHVGVEVGAVRPGLGGPDPRQDDDLPPPFLPHDDPDASLAVYRDTLGFEVRNDVAYGGMCWITIGPTPARHVHRPVSAGRRPRPHRRRAPQPSSSSPAEATGRRRAGRPAAEPVHGG